ncbi:hypothetical protein MTR67_039425 [Solanum verrucosum]|uniref:Protein DAMAGED DNA-BINDING 2 n=1 Tax=Solanum verrucosum TaxID=315347 RepID=A0AAF0ZQP0_SOLVR|nr:hypothetical protein MTR67_039425 [Solanum verrucosum]
MRRRSLFPQVVIDRDTESEESSSEEEEEANVVLPEEERVQKGKTPITITLKKVCKVCKKSGHEAGFRGATYIDCPMKPCFLCKMPGHTTVTCPHRVATEYGMVPAPHKNTTNPLEFVFQRQLHPRLPPIKPAHVIPDQVHCAVIRYHSRRVTCLEFHPTNNNILLSGDKKGQLGIWDFGKVYEKTVYGNIHNCILNNMKFNPTNDGSIYAASSDGTISCTDLETGISLSLMNLNPNGWEGPSSWRMLYGLDVNSDRSVVLVADNFGYLYMADIRSNNKMSKPTLIHKKGTKVVGLNCNPLQPDLLLSCGNDHFDSSESLVVIGRYISENYDGAALHPIDFINISTGQLVAEVMDPNITTISSVNKLHPREDILASGSSRSLFIWRPKKLDIALPREEKRMVLCGEVSKKRNKKHGDESDDDSENDIFRSKDNSLKQKKLASKSSSYKSRRS